MKKYFTCFIVCTFLNCFSSSAYANESYLPVDMSTALVLKVLPYDWSLSQRFADNLTLGILYDVNDKEEAEYAKNFHDKMTKAAENHSVGGLKLKSLLLTHTGSTDKEEITSLLKEKGVSVLLVLTRNQAMLQKISQVTQDLGINSFCFTKECLESGITFGVLHENDKPKMYINIDSMKREGTDYNGKLLSLCERIHSKDKK